MILPVRRGRRGGPAEPDPERLIQRANITPARDAPGFRKGARRSEFGNHNTVDTSERPPQNAVRPHPVYRLVAIARPYCGNEA